jgi:hypothetical protein
MANYHKLSSQALGVHVGHKLLKKKMKNKAFSSKTDSYVLETNVHFPTDLNLLHDSLRKEGLTWWKSL